MNASETYGRIYVSFPEDMVFVGHVKTMCVNCAVCRNPLSKSKVIDGVNASEYKFSQHTTDVDILIYPFTYAGTWDICSDCESSARMYVNRNAERFKLRDMDTDLLMSNEWLQDRLNNLISKKRKGK